MSKKLEILEVACESLQKKGVNGFSFRDLADAVGVKSSSVHYHFANKSELFKAIVEHFSSNVSEHLQSIDAQSSSLEECLFAFIDIFEASFKEDKFCVCGMLAADRQHLDEEVLEAITASFTAIETWLVSVINKYPNDKLEANSLAHLIISSCEGSLLIDRAVGEKKYLDSLRKTLKALLG